MKMFKGTLNRGFREWPSEEETRKKKHDQISCYIDCDKICHVKIAILTFKYTVQGH